MIGKPEMQVSDPEGERRRIRRGLTLFISAWTMITLNCGGNQAGKGDVSCALSDLCPADETSHPHEDLTEDRVDLEERDGTGEEIVCPPIGPFGYDEGDVLTNITLSDCDGRQVSLHDLCGANAGLIFNFYGW
jgi:hypothetical protein